MSRIFAAACLLCLSNVVYTQPSTFSLVSPSNGAFANATPKFDWETAADANFYQLFIDGNLTKDNIGSSEYQLNSEEALSEGLHTWYVNAVDNMGNGTNSNETWSVRIDGSPPDEFDLVSPADGGWESELRPSFQWSASADPLSGIARYELWIDGALSRSVPPSSTSSLPSSDLTRGPYTWLVRAIDNVGNIRSSSSSRTVRIDNLPPTGDTNGVVSFDGINDYIEIPYVEAYEIYGALTIEAWVLIREYVQYGGALSKGGLINLRQLDGRINFGRGNHTGPKSNSIIPLDTWTHIAVTYNGSRVNFYMNGQFDGSGEENLIPYSNTDGIYIGKNPRNAGWGRTGRHWNGFIDEVRVWSKVRTGDEIRETMHTILGGDENGLVGYWRFNEISGGQVTDFSSQNNNGVLFGGAAFAVQQIQTADLGTIGLTSPKPDQFLGTTEPTFSWAPASDKGSGFKHYQLWIDGSLREDNLSDTTTGLALPASEGMHDWYIESFDTLDNSQISELRMFGIDTQGPSTFALVSPLDSAIVDIPTPTFSWGASEDDGSGLSGYQLWIDSTLSVDGITGTSSAPGSPLTEGIHSWYTTAVDKVGNGRRSAEVWTVIWDPSPPAAFDLISPAERDTVVVRRPVFTWQASNDVESGLKRYELWVNGVRNKANILPSDTSTTPVDDLDDGVYNWFVKAVDFAENSTASTSVWDIVVNRDVAPPVSNILQPQDGATIGGDTLSIKGTSSDGRGSGVAVVELRIDGGDWEPVRNTGADFDTWAHLSTSFAEGTYTIQTRATDKEGNVEIPSPGITVTVDRSKPSVSSVTVAPNPAKAGQIAVTINLDAGAGEIDNSASPMVTFSPAGDTTRLAIQQTVFQGPMWQGTANIDEDMNNGRAIIQVSGVQNTLGNAMAPNKDAGSFVIDTVPPEAESVTVTPDPAKAGNIEVQLALSDTTSGLHPNSPPSVTFTPSGGAQVAVTQTSYNPTTGLWIGQAEVTTSLNEGLATIRVANGADVAGNIMPEVVDMGSFLIDVTPPSVFDLASPADSSWTSEAKPILSWNASSDATSGLAKYQLFIDSEEDRDGISPSITLTQPSAGLSEGSHRWYTVAVDSAGNERQSSSSWLLLVDRTAPQSQITNLTSGQEVVGTILIEGTANDNSEANAGIGVDSVYVSTDGGATWQPATNTGTDFDSWSYEWTVPENASFTIKSKAVDKLGNEETPGEGVVVTEVKNKRQATLPTEFSLSQNYPNPFNPETRIDYALPEAGSVRIEVFNILGKKVRTLVEKEQQPGYYSVLWDATDDNGNPVPSGVYVVSMRAEGFAQTRKIVLLK